MVSAGQKWAILLVVFTVTVAGVLRSSEAGPVLVFAATVVALCHRRSHQPAGQSLQRGGDRDNTVRLATCRNFSFVSLLCGLGQWSLFKPR